MDGIWSASLPQKEKFVHVKVDGGGTQTQTGSVADLYY